MKTNALAAALADFPGFLREYGSRILLGFLIVALIIVLIFNYTRGRSERDLNSREALTTARENVDHVRGEMQALAQLPPWARMPSPDRIADVRNQSVKDAETSLRLALESNDPKVQSEAYTLRGDLNLLLASFPPLPGSDTRPSLNGDKSREDLLKSAQEAYNEALKIGQNPTAVRNARFGLATVAENLGDWDKARQSYQQIIDDPSTPQIFKDQAKDKLANLAELQKPILLATRPSAPEATTLPAGPMGPILPPGLTTNPTATTQPATTQP